jgi:hypothetical protein
MEKVQPNSQSTLREMEKVQPNSQTASISSLGFGGDGRTWKENGKGAAKQPIDMSSTKHTKLPESNNKQTKPRVQRVDSVCTQSFLAAAAVWILSFGGIEIYLINYAI